MWFVLTDRMATPTKTGKVCARRGGLLRSEKRSVTGVVWLFGVVAIFGSEPSGACTFLRPHAN